MEKNHFDEHYILKEEIGKGAFAVVHIGESKKDGARYAVKIINKTPNNKETIETEIEIMQRVSNHKNIVKLVDKFETSNHYYLVLELITGGELFDKIIEIQSYSEQDASRVIRQLLEAINYVHSQEIVHRDLKPENLLLSSKELNADIKLADFGLSKDLHKTPNPVNCAGTPGYLAPEILEAYYNKVPYGKKVDVWSSGVILYILLYGFPPFWEEDQDEMFEKIRRGEFSFPDSIPISEIARDCIEKMLTVDPQKRLAAEAMLKHPFVVGHDVSALPLPPHFMENIRKFNARRRLKGAIAAVRAINKLKISPTSPPPARVTVETHTPVLPAISYHDTKK